MENLKKCFSDKFLEKVLQLGHVLPVNDEKFYLIFKPFNQLAATVEYKGTGSIAVHSMDVLDYNCLSIKTKEQVEEGCNEGQALWVLKILQNR